MKLIVVPVSNRAVREIFFSNERRVKKCRLRDHEMSVENYNPECYIHTLCAGLFCVISPADRQWLSPRFRSWLFLRHQGCEVQAGRGRLRWLARLRRPLALLQNDAASWRRTRFVRWDSRF